MSFTAGIPRSGQSLGNSRPQVQGNFDYIDTAFAINHVAFNASGVGKHKFLQMPEQGSAPISAANEGALYAKEAGSIANLFWRQESNGTEIQMTNIAPVNLSSGYTFLPGGFLIQWDRVTTIGTSTPVTFPVAFDAATFPYSIQLTIAQALGSTAISVSVGAGGSLTNTGFNLRSTSSALLDVYYLAIGKRTT